MFAPSDELPAGYEKLKIETFRDRVSGPQAYSRLGCGLRRSRGGASGIGVTGRLA
jgi:hypothetical protein